LPPPPISPYLFHMTALGFELRDAQLLGRYSYCLSHSTNQGYLGKQPESHFWEKENR
jgi:hypothetical protein